MESGNNVVQAADVVVVEISIVLEEMMKYFEFEHRCEVIFSVEVMQ